MADLTDPNVIEPSPSFTLIRPPLAAPVSMDG
jgi:hypothetical protein